MTGTWSSQQLKRIERAGELEIAARRADGTLRRWVPIWVVCAAEHVYVRTWYRRDHGWFGQAVATSRARIRVPGLERDVAVEDVGQSMPELRDLVDVAYRAKYGASGGSSVGGMVSLEAAASTLRLIPLTAMHAGEGASRPPQGSAGAPDQER